MDFIAICSLILVVAAHELGHALAGKRLGIRIKNISLFGLGPMLISWKSSFFGGARVGFGPLPYGAYVSFIEKDLKKLSTAQHDDISFAGPHMNFVVGTFAGFLFLLIFGITKPILISTCICALLTLRPIKLLALYTILPLLAMCIIGYMLRPESLSKSVSSGALATAVNTVNFFNFDDFVKKFLYNINYWSVLLGVLNLLPVYPLDGGQVAKNFARKVLNEENWLYKLLFVYVPVVFVILMLLPLIGDTRKVLSFLF